MPAANPRGVYVSNVPYDMTEEQLTHIMSEAGPVAKTKLAFHSDTGRAKGFGFVDFYVETAASAVRNLNGYLVSGRPLTISPQQDGSSREAAAAGDDANALHALVTDPPRGIVPPQGVKATDAISQTLAAIPQGQLEEVLARMKGLVVSSPGEARQILIAHPQLAYALFQAMLMMNIVDPSVIQRMTSSTTPSYPQPAMAAHPPPPAPSHPSYPAGGPPPPQAYPPYPPQGYPPPPSFYPQPPAPVQAPPPPSQAIGVPTANIKDLSPEQQTAVMGVLQLSKEQVDGLPEAQKVQVVKLRAMYGGL